MKVSMAWLYEQVKQGACLVRQAERTDERYSTSKIITSPQNKLKRYVVLADQYDTEAGLFIPGVSTHANQEVTEPPDLNKNSDVTYYRLVGFY